MAITCLVDRSDPLVSAMDENSYNIFMLCVPKDEETDLPILTDGNITITRVKVIISISNQQYLRTVIRGKKWKEVKGFDQNNTPKIKV